MQPASTATAAAARYQPIRRLEGGRTSVVFEAEEAGTKRRVAIKAFEVPPHEQQLREVHRVIAEISAARHEHICPVYELGQDAARRPFVVADLLVGENLEQRRFAHGGFLSVGRAAHIGCQVLDALAAAHQRGVVHGDLRGEHVFLIHRGHDPDFVQLLDFGVSRLSASPTGFGGQHLAPEQLEHSAHVGPAADIYAVGALLYRLVTGLEPYASADRCQLLRDIAAGGPRPLHVVNPQVPAGFDAAVVRALSAVPENRWSSASEFSRALAAFAVPLIQSPGAVAATHTGTSRIGRTKGWRRAGHRSVLPLFAVAVAALAVALAIGLVVMPDPSGARVVVPVDAAPVATPGLVDTAAAVVAPTADAGVETVPVTETPAVVDKVAAESPPRAERGGKKGTRVGAGKKVTRGGKGTRTGGKGRRTGGGKGTGSGGGRGSGTGGGTGCPPICL